MPLSFSRHRFSTSSQWRKAWDEKGGEKTFLMNVIRVIFPILADRLTFCQLSRSSDERLFSNWILKDNLLRSSFILQFIHSAQHVFLVFTERLFVMFLSLIPLFQIHLYTMISRALNDAPAYCQLSKWECQVSINSIQARTSFPSDFLLQLSFYFYSFTIPRWQFLFQCDT